jgi:meiotic recombination protein SPO11
MDYDPDGMDILSTYKHGSAALAHEKAELALPCIQWLGLSSKDIGGQDDLHEVQGLLTLSARDRRKAARMLERGVFSGDVEPECRKQLQRMLVLNVKAEIQILEARQGGLPRWLEEKGLC